MSKRSKTNKKASKVFLSKEAAQFKGLFSPKYEKWLATEVELLAQNNFGTWSSVEEANSFVDKAIKELAKTISTAVEPEVKRIIDESREDIVTDMSENVVAGPNLPQMGPDTPAPAPTTVAAPATAPAPAPVAEPTTMAPTPASKLSKVIKALSANASLTLNEAPEDIYKMKANIDTMLNNAGIGSFEAALDNGQYKFIFESDNEAKVAHDVLDSEGFNVMLNDSGEIGMNREQKEVEEEQLLDEAPQRWGKDAQNYGAPSAENLDDVMYLPEEFGQDINIGDLVEVSEGSGILSGATGIIIDPQQVPTKQTGGGLIPDIPGHYQPADWDNEVAIQLDDGSIELMFIDRLRKVGTAKKASITKKLAEAFEESERKGDNFDADLSQTEKAIDDAMRENFEEPEPDGDIAPRKADKFDSDLAETKKNIDKALSENNDSLDQPKPNIAPRKAQADLPGRVEVFDNGGETADRYTVIIDNQDVYTMSERPSHPQGVSQFAGEMNEMREDIRESSGTPVSINELPEEVIQGIKDRMGGTEESFIATEAALELRPVGSNMTEVETDTVIVLFSYSTPVAYMDKASGQCFRTLEKFSTTTSRHINKWLEGRPAEEVDQAQIEGLVNTANAEIFSIEAVESLDKEQAEKILSKIVGEAVDLADFKEVVLEEQELVDELETKDDMSKHTRIQFNKEEE